MADNPVDELAFEIGAAMTAGATPAAIAQHLVAAGWQRPQRARLHPLGGLGLTALAAGAVAGVFVDWRWAIVGLACWWCAPQLVPRCTGSRTRRKTDPCLRAGPAPTYLRSQWSSVSAGRREALTEPGQRLTPIERSVPR